MDTQDLGRTHSSGSESHGVHVCQKCGWPFPKSHPSSRHRRAHKRICGTIEGYKLAGSEVNTHLNDSDDDHSDDELKTPSPKVLESSNNEKGSGAFGEGSVKSEDGMFSDAVAEFSDSGSGAGTGERLEDVRESATNAERVSKNDLIAIQSLNGGEIIDNTINQLGYAPDSQGSLSTSNISSIKSSESAVQEVRNGSEDDLHPIKYEMLADASEDSRKTHATDSVTESSLTSVSQEGKIKGIEASNLDRNFPYAVISPNKAGGETAKGVSKFEGTVDMTPDSVRDNEVVPSEKELSHAFDLYIPQIDLPPEAESAVQANASIDTAENKVDSTDVIPDFSAGGLTESSIWKGEGNANVHVLTLPDDIPVVDNPEAMIEGFKSHKEEKLDQPTFLDSWEQFNDKESDVKDPVSKEKFEFFPSSHLSGSTVASSDLHDLEASSKPIVKEVPAEEEAKLPEIESNITENQINPAAKLHENEDAGDYEKSITKTCNIIGDAGYHESESCKLAGDDDSKGATENIFAKDPVSNLESASSLSELQVDPVSNSHEVGDTGDYDKDKTESHDKIGGDGEHKAEKSAIAGDDYSKVFTEKIVVENPITTLESASSLSELKVNPATNFHNGDDPSDHDEVEIEKSVISGNESREGPVEENILVTPNLNLDPSFDLDESKTVAEGEMGGSVMRLVDTRCFFLDSISNSSGIGLHAVSDTQQGVIDEIDCNDKVQIEVGVSNAAALDHVPDVESSQKSLEGYDMKELSLSSLGAEDSVRSFTAAEDNCSTEFCGVASELNSQSLQEESDKNSVRQQLSSAALDVSVDSNSQADSLEGNWGSVSVLSIQSDAQAEAVRPTDSQASLEEKTDLKSKAASERQFSDKSDTFEAPSFMTLVEPGGGDDQKAKASEILTAQNPEQPKPASLQTGWFPSITHVANESQGRKKNEEIIAKVTNWSTGKQHTPLKNLLGEAYLENKAKSPNQKESLAAMHQKDDRAEKESGPVPTTVNSILAPESPAGQAAMKETAKEWNSPARYPSEVKSEKRKAKGRPYWAQFVCCSSVH